MCSITLSSFLHSFISLLYVSCCHHVVCVLLLQKIVQRQICSLPSGRSLPTTASITQRVVSIRQRRDRVYRTKTPCLPGSAKRFPRAYPPCRDAIRRKSTDTRITWPEAETATMRDHRKSGVVTWAMTSWRASGRWSDRRGRWRTSRGDSVRWSINYRRSGISWADRCAFSLCCHFTVGKRLKTHFCRLFPPNAGSAKRGIATETVSVRNVDLS